MRRAAAAVVAFAMALAGVVAVPGAVTALDVGAWQYNPATGHYYRLVLVDDARPEAGLTWTRAEAYAVSVGGHLVTVNDQAEQDWLAVNFHPAPIPGDLRAPRPLWIGLNDQAVEGVWVWSSGETATYRDWVTDQPDNCLPCSGDQGEDAVVMNWTDENWPGPPPNPLGWNDLAVFDTHSGAIVEVTALPRGPVGGQVTGNYHYFVFDESATPARARQVSVSATGTDPLKGQWSLTWPATKATVSGDVTCLVVDGDQAWVAGRITKMKNINPADVGEGVFLWVRDGAAAGVPDRAYSWIGDLGQPLAELEGWCLSRNVSMPEGFADGFTVDRGNVMVRPGG